MDSLPQTKTCSHCGQVKPITDFYRHKKSGYTNPCKACANARGRKHYQEHREQRRIWRRQYYLENREHLIQQSVEWAKNNAKHRAVYQHVYWEQNKDSLSQYRREWYRANKDRMLSLSKKRYRENKALHAQQAKKWRQQHPQERRAISRRYKIRRRGAIALGHHTEQEWEELCRKYDYRCVCCLAVVGAQNLERDHIRPLCWGNATDKIANIQPLCRSCNAAKGGRHDIDYRIDFWERLLSE